MTATERNRRGLLTRIMGLQNLCGHEREAAIAAEDAGNEAEAREHADNAVRLSRLADKYLDAYEREAVAAGGLDVAIEGLLMEAR